MFDQIPGGSSEIIQGLKCWIPKQPPKHLIAGYDLPKKQQKFIHTDLPKEWDEWREEEELRLSVDDSFVHPKIEAFKKQEWERRLFGYWFYNNGKVVYITGKHYFYINWWSLDTGRPQYRDTDRKLFYFWQYCIEDPNCYGMVEATMRRQGKSYRATCEMYEEISRPPQKQSGGIQSKTGDDAKEMFIEKLVEPWKDLPDFFKPESNSGSDPKTSMSFFKNAKKGKDAKKVKHHEDAELRSFIDWKPAKEKAYDGKAKKRMLHDECGKTDPKEEADVWERLKVIKPCLVKNGTIWGKAYLSTTVEDLDKGGEEFKKIWNNSNHQNPHCVDQNGQTVSGLYRYFLSALEGTYYDEYGYPVIENPTPEQREYLAKTYGKQAANGSRSFYEVTRKQLESSPNELASFMHKFPFTEDEMFMTSGDKCEFNAFILNKRERELELNFNITTRGDFVWDKEKDGSVKFVHNDINGRFYVSKIILFNEANKVAPCGLVEGIQQFKPTNCNKFSIGTDPVDHGVTVDGRKSSPAAYVFEKFDLLIDNPNAVYTNEDIKISPESDWKMGKIKWKTYLPIVEYIFRPDDPIEYYEDMIKACRYFGCKILAENNKVGIINHFRARGYREFIMNRPEATFTKEGESQDTPGMPSSQPMIQQYTSKIASYVQHHGHRIPFIRLIRDLKIFDPKNPRKHDATVAFGFTLIGAENKEEEPAAPIEIEELFNMYDNRGMSSSLSI